MASDPNTPQQSTADEKGVVEDRKPDTVNPQNKLGDEPTTIQTETAHEQEVEPKSGTPIPLIVYPVTDLENNIIGWDGQDDPENPRNFSPKVKWTSLALVSSVTLVSPLASSMFAPGVSIMNQEFHNTSITLSSFVVSVFVLGYAVGPLFLGPLSEIYGRAPILNLANSSFVVWQIGCALSPNLSSLIVFRLLAGIGGSACMTIGGGIVSDLFTPHQRGRATAICAMGPLIGPVLGPICGGFMAQRLGWRWIYYVLLIASGTVTSLIWIFYRESNPQVLISRKVIAQRKITGNKDLQSWYDKDVSPKSRRQVLSHGLMRPLKLLIFSPIVALLSLYMAIIYGLMYFLLTTVTTVFREQYGWQTEMTGLAYIGLGIGLFLGIGVVAKISDATLIKLTARNGGVSEPEMRLPACIMFGIFLPISLFWYGWATKEHAHWIVAIISMVPFGFGVIGVFIPIQAYLIDAFPDYAASVTASLTAARSLCGAFLPLAGSSMYVSMGLGWGNSLLGFLAILLLPFLPFIYKYGGDIRKKWPINIK